MVFRTKISIKWPFSKYDWSKSRKNTYLLTIVKTLQINQKNSQRATKIMKRKKVCNEMYLTQREWRIQITFKSISKNEIKNKYHG